MDEQMVELIEQFPDTAMITRRPDGSAHMARIEVAMVDGRLWSSGAPHLIRTRNLRHDPRCSLYFAAPRPDHRWLGLETEVALLDGPDAPELHVRLMRARHGDGPAGTVMGHDDALGHDRPYPLDEYLDHVRAEQRLIYEFAVRRAYGNV